MNSSAQFIFFVRRDNGILPVDGLNQFPAGAFVARKDSRHGCRFL
jgi:hypothetical protein